METTTITLTARQRMRLALDLAGITAQDAADALEVHPNTITNWLTGRTWPRRGDRRELARVCGQPASLACGAQRRSLGLRYWPQRFILNPVGRDDPPGSRKPRP